MAFSVRTLGKQLAKLNLKKNVSDLFLKKKNKAKKTYY